MTDDLVKRAHEALDGVTPLAGWLRNPWSKSDSVERGPIPEWLAALLFEAASKIEASSGLIPAMADRIRELEAKLAKAWDAAFEGRTDLMITADNARDAAKTDHRWEGVADVLMRRVRQIDATLKEIDNG